MEIQDEYKDADDGSLLHLWIECNKPESISDPWLETHRMNQSGAYPELELRRSMS